MAQQNFYKANLRDLSFLLFEQFHIEDLLSKEPYVDWGKDEVLAVLEESYGWVQKHLGPINSIGDEVGCKLVDGQVKVPPGFKEAWKALFDAGWRTLATDAKHGGQGGPFTLAMMVEEFMSGACTSFNMYPALTQGAADVIVTFGTPEQQTRWVPNMMNGTWSGTMCLTETQAGSDVGSAATQATKNADGTYNIKGTKIYISGGDQDMSANIVHMVLARTPDAPAGTKGLSLFIVPKRKLDGTSNDVTTTGIEHKMGIKASSTAQLAFGDNGTCVGELVGSIEQKGMSQMFHLMNAARYFVPHILALSTNSPFWLGMDTGLKSYRCKVFDKFPRTNIPDYFPSWGEYESFVNLLIKTNCIDNAKKIWWDIRPHPHFPTLEFRICDVPMRLDETIAIAALIQATVAKLYKLHASNQGFRLYRRLLIMENKWRALRYGLDGKLVDFGKSTEVPLRELMMEYLEFVDDVVDELGSRKELDYIHTMMAMGSGADRQLRVFKETGDLKKVVDYIVEETETGVII